MATIQTRKRKDGSVGYTARIRIKRAGVIVHEEAKTFDGRRYKRRDVERWASAREHELSAPDAVLGPQSTLTLGQAVARYCREYPGWGRSKTADLARLQSARIASLPIVLIRPQHLIEHVRVRRETVGPATAGNDLIWLRVLFKVAARAWRVPVAVQVVDDAVAHCREQRLIGRARQRSGVAPRVSMLRPRIHFGQARIASVWLHVKGGDAEPCGQPAVLASPVVHHSPSPLRAASMAAYTSSASSSLTFVAGM